MGELFAKPNTYPPLIPPRRDWRLRILNEDIFETLRYGVGLKIQKKIGLIFNKQCVSGKRGWKGENQVGELSEKANSHNSGVDWDPLELSVGIDSMRTKYIEGIKG